MHPTLDIEAIAWAIGERAEVRARLARDYGLQIPPEDPVAFSNALVRAFDQTPLDDPLAADPSPRDVFRCAVLALGSNSRSWVAFLGRRDELEGRLHALEPEAVADEARRGSLRRILFSSGASPRKHWPEGQSSWGETRMAYYRRLRAEHRK